MPLSNFLTSHCWGSSLHSIISVPAIAGKVSSKFRPPAIALEVLAVAAPLSGLM